MQRASFALPACTPLEPWTPDQVATSKAPRLPPWNTHFESEETSAYLWGMTEECLDDVGVARFIAVPGPKDTWRDATNAENRLLAQLDGVLAFGPDIEERLRDSLPDFATPAQFFAATLVAGSIESKSSVGLIEHLWAQGLDQDDEVMASITDGLCRASHPEISGLARARLAHPEARIRASAVTVLDARGEACTDAVFALLTDPSPLVLSAVIRAMLHPAAPLHPISQVAELLTHPDELVVAAALKTCVAKRFGQGHSRALAICREGRFAFADAAVILALYGDERDVESFAGWVRPGVDPALVRALGYVGAADLIGDLIGLLADEAIAPNAASALIRVTGADLVENAKVPLYGAEDKPFVDDPDAVTSVSREVVDPKVWLQWWSQHRGRFFQGNRYRSGEIYGAASVYRALDTGPAIYEERGFAHLEFLALAGNAVPHLVLSDWVARQSGPMAQSAQWARSAPTLTRGWLHART